MDDSLNPFARQSAHELIVAKRDRLVAERAELIEQRLVLLHKIRRADRELADCRAAARLFELEIEFPDDEDRSMREREMMAERDRAYSDRRRAEEAVRAAARHYTQVVEAKTLRHVVAPEGAALPAPPPDPKPSRPPLKEVILEQLKIVSPSGRKAAEMREYIERAFGENIHEKTVGMTLYRLSKDRLVHRDGHNWFFGSATAEAGNPGGETPGLNLLDD